MMYMIVFLHNKQKKKHILHINWIVRQSSESVYDGQAFK